MGTRQTSRISIRRRSLPPGRRLCRFCWPARRIVRRHPIRSWPGSSWW